MFGFLQRFHARNVCENSCENLINKLSEALQTPSFYCSANAAIAVAGLASVGFLRTRPRVGGGGDPRRGMTAHKRRNLHDAVSGPHGLRVLIV
jgi:hypothetical protein